MFIYIKEKKRLEVEGKVLDAEKFLKLFPEDALVVTADSIQKEVKKKVEVGPKGQRRSIEISEFKEEKFDGAAILKKIKASKEFKEAKLNLPEEVYSSEQILNALLFGDEEKLKEIRAALKGE